MKMEERVLQLSSKVENFINTHKQEAELNKAKHIENKLSKRMSHMEKQIWEELEKMQTEYQSGVSRYFLLSQEYLSLQIPLSF